MLGSSVDRAEAPASADNESRTHTHTHTHTQTVAHDDIAATQAASSSPAPADPHLQVDTSGPGSAAGPRHTGESSSASSSSPSHPMRESTDLCAFVSESAVTEHLGLFPWGALPTRPSSAAGKDVAKAAAPFTLVVAGDAGCRVCAGCAAATACTRPCMQLVASGPHIRAVCDALAKHAIRTESNFNDVAHQFITVDILYQDGVMAQVYDGATGLMTRGPALMYSFAYDDLEGLLLITLPRGQLNPYRSKLHQGRPFRFAIHLRRPIFVAASKLLKAFLLDMRTAVRLEKAGQSFPPVPAPRLAQDALLAVHAAKRAASADVFLQRLMLHAPHWRPERGPESGTNASLSDSSSPIDVASSEVGLAPSIAPLLSACVASLEETRLRLPPPCVAHALMPNMVLHPVDVPARLVDRLRGDAAGSDQQRHPKHPMPESLPPTMVPPFVLPSAKRITIPVTWSLYCCSVFIVSTPGEQPELSARSSAGKVLAEARSRQPPIVRINDDAALHGHLGLLHIQPRAPTSVSMAYALYQLQHLLRSRLRQLSSVRACGCAASKQALAAQTSVRLCPHDLAMEEHALSLAAPMLHPKLLDPAEATATLDAHHFDTACPPAYPSSVWNFAHMVWNIATHHFKGLSVTAASLPLPVVEAHPFSALDAFIPPAPRKRAHRRALSDRQPAGSKRRSIAEACVDAADADPSGGLDEDLHSALRRLARQAKGKRKRRRSHLAVVGLPDADAMGTSRDLASGVTSAASADESARVPSTAGSYGPAATSENNPDAILPLSPDRRERGDGSSNLMSMLASVSSFGVPFISFPSQPLDGFTSPSTTTAPGAGGLGPDKVWSLKFNFPAPVSRGPLSISGMLRAINSPRPAAPASAAHADMLPPKGDAWDSVTSQPPALTSRPVFVHGTTALLSPVFAPAASAAL